MARDPTRFSRVSVGWVDSAQSIVDVDAGDTDPVWSVIGEAQYDSPVRVSSTLTVTSNASLGGTVTAGGGGTVFNAISSTTHAIDFGNVTLQGASETTVGVSNATRGDTFIVTPDSEWSGTGGSDNNLVVHAYSGDTTGEVTVVANNSGATDHNPAETIFRLTRIDFPDFI